MLSLVFIPNPNLLIRNLLFFILNRNHVWTSYQKGQRKSLIGIIFGVHSLSVMGSELSRWTTFAVGGLGVGVGLFLNKNKK
tara:strand:+ start:100 stop:342 length:243 start_codon:yes stop_codon:yes gene_type:complete